MSQSYAEVTTREDADEISLKRLSISSSTSSKAPDNEYLIPHQNCDHSQRFPRKDVGSGPWRFLFGAWLLELMLWGFPLCFGIFQDHYSNEPLFIPSAWLIPSVGAVAAGISYLGVPVVNPIVIRRPRYHRHVVALGWLLCVLGLVGASFATRTWHLVLTQGALYGTGWVVCYTPFLIMLNEWFDRRRGLAYGILFGASGISGLFLPFVLNWLLMSFGFRVTLRAYAAAAIVISGPGLLLIKPRIPADALVSPDRAHELEKRQSTSTLSFLNHHLRSPPSVIFAVANILQGVAFFVPNIFLPSYARGLGLPDTTGPLLLAINAAAQVTGQIILGHSSDKVSPHIPPCVSAAASSAAVFLLLGPATGVRLLICFTLVWGFFAGLYTVLWTRVAAGLAEGVPEDTMALYAAFSFERGVVSALAGPISAALLRDTETVPGAYGLLKYDRLVVFTGLVLALSALGGIAWFWERAAVRRMNHL